MFYSVVKFNVSLRLGRWGRATLSVQAIIPVHRPTLTHLGGTPYTPKIMLNTMRRNMKTILLGLVVVTAVTFVGWNYLVQGIRGGGENPTSAIATVNGEKIPYEAFVRHEEELTQELRYYTGSTTTDVQQAKIRRAALDDLINNKLELGAVNRVGIVVSADEVARRIRSFPELQSNGTFDPQKYQQFVTSQAGSSAAFEESVRRNAERGHLEAYLQDSSQVTGSELEDQAKMEEEEATVRYAEVSSDSFAKTSDVPAAEVSRYYDEHPEEFRKITTADERVAKKKASDILAQIKRGASFEAMAKKYSEDTANASRGGDLGFFGKGMMVADFEKAAFALRTPGQIVGPVKTSFGYHLIQFVERRKESSRTPKTGEEIHCRHILIKMKPHALSLVEAESDIRKQLALPKAQPTARAKAEALAKALRSGTPWVAAAKPFGGVHTAGPFRRGDDQSKTASIPSEIRQEAFRMRVNEIADVVEAGGNFYVAECTSRKEGKKSDPLDRDQLREQLLRQKGRAAMEDWLAAERDRAKITDSLAKLAEADRRASTED